MMKLRSTRAEEGKWAGKDTGLSSDRVEVTMKIPEDRIQILQNDKISLLFRTIP